MGPLNRLVLPAIGTAVTLPSLLLAERFGGPMVRQILGPPVGFQQDFTSTAALRQALLVQGTFLAVAFLLFGTAMAARGSDSLSYKHAVWSANPVTVRSGSAAYKMAYYALHFPDVSAEYDSLKVLGLLSIVSPILLASCFYAGLCLKRSRSA
jgi:hypothetical protein